MANFVEKDLPAVIRYENGTLALIQNMSEVKWTERFGVLQTNVGQEDIGNDTVNVIPEDHWIKKEVDHYYIPKAPLKNFFMSQRVKSDIIDSFKRAIQWSTLYGTKDTVDPDVLVLNLIHQVFGTSEEELHGNNSHVNLNLRKDVVELNRYLIDYTTKDGLDQIHCFISKAPNATLAKMELNNEVSGVPSILSVNKVTEIEETDILVQIFNTPVFEFSVVYRLRNEWNSRLCYFTTKKEDTDEAMVDFINQYPEAIVKSFKRVLATEEF